MRRSARAPATAARSVVGRPGQAVQPPRPPGQQAGGDRHERRPRRAGRGQELDPQRHRRHEAPDRALGGHLGDPELGPHPLQVLLDLRRRPGNGRGVQTDEPGRLPHLVDVLVGLAGQQPAARAQVRGEERVDLRAVHPQQQVRVVHPERPAGLGLDPRAQPPVQRPQRGAGRLGLAARPEGDRAQPLAGALQPAPGVLPVGGVCLEAGHDQRMRGLQQQRPEPGHDHRRVAVDPPGDRARAEQPLELGPFLVRRGHCPHPSIVAPRG